MLRYKTHGAESGNHHALQKGIGNGDHITALILELIICHSKYRIPHNAVCRFVYPRAPVARCLL